MSKNGNTIKETTLLEKYILKQWVSPTSSEGSKIQALATRMITSRTGLYAWVNDEIVKVSKNNVISMVVMYKNIKYM